MREKLPTFTVNQSVGNRAASELQTVMKKFSVFQEIDTSQDLGIDFIGTIIENCHPTKYNFNAQCKGTDDSEVKMNAGKTEFTYSIKTQTINYWRQKKDVTFLFLVDIKKEIIFWTAPLREVENRDLSKQDSVTIHIPVNNLITSKTDCLSSNFKFEIIRYYACFGQDIVSQLKQIQHINDNNDIANMLELMGVLEKNMMLVKNKYDEIINELNNKIEEDLKCTINYCVMLDQMDDVVRRYCPNGIFNAKFSGGANEKTIEECKIELEKYVESDTISYEKLYELSKEIYEIRRNVLAFLREMVYEDMPFTKHPDIDEECSRVLGY